MQLQFARLGDAERRQAKIVAGLRGVLGDVRAAVEDWRRDAADRARPRSRSCATIRRRSRRKRRRRRSRSCDWMDHDHFTFLGYREYRLRGRGRGRHARILPGSGLGILRDDRASTCLRRPAQHGQPAGRGAALPARAGGADPRHQGEPAVDGPPSRFHARHHRGEAFDADGQVVGERLFVGLFTSAAYADQPARDAAAAPEGRARSSSAPVSRATATTARRWSTSSRPIRATSCSRSARTIFSAPPSASCTCRSATALALFVRHDPFERFVSCLRLRAARPLRHRTAPASCRRSWPRPRRPRSRPSTPRSGDAALARLHFIVRDRPGERAEGRGRGAGGELIEPRRAPGTTSSSRRWSPGAAKAEGLALARR